LVGERDSLGGEGGIDPRLAVEYGAAHGALASTTPGDTSIATRWDAERSIAGESARLVS